MDFINLIRGFFIKNKGFDELREESKILREGNHYTTLGGQLEAKFGEESVIRESRNYKDIFDKITWEPQRRKVETMFCTVFNTIKAVVAKMILVDGIPRNYDEIPTANDAGVSPYKGGSPHAVGESGRHHGLFPPGTYPFDDSIISKEQLIMTPTNDMYAKAAKWLESWDFGHEWVYPGIVGTIQESMWHALKYSPLGAGVYAWHYDNNKKMYTKPDWARDNHWTVICGGEYGKYWLIYDSYEDFSKTPYKKVDWNYPFAFVKRYYLKKKNMTQQEAGENLYERVKGKRIQRTDKENGGHGEVYLVGDEIVYEGWWTNSKAFQKAINDWLTGEYKAGRAIPVSEKDFEDLTAYIKLAGIPLKDDGLSAVSKLNDNL